MRALHLLRSKQEKSEIGYWLSFVAFNPDDQSVLNRIYLLYLVIFLACWVCVVLFFFAKYGGMILGLFDPSDGPRAAFSVLGCVFAVWFFIGMWQSSKCSPVVFSEQDAVQVCQTPIDRRLLVLRWIWMPWVRNVIPFSLLALTLGFSVAETLVHGTITAGVFFRYIGFGFRAVLWTLPFHLTLFVSQWIVGVLRLQKSAIRNWMRLPAVLLSLSLIGFLIWALIPGATTGAQTLHLVAANWLLGCFTDGFCMTSILPGVLAALVSLIILFFASGSFNLSHAAQETAEADLLNNAARYGFTDFAEQRRLQKRLPVGRGSNRTLDQKGVHSLIWKNSLQVRRSFHWTTLYTWLTLLGISFGLPILPTFWSRLLAALFFVIQVGPLLASRFRDDLKCWTIFSSLPIAKNRMLLYELCCNLPLVLLVCTLGLALSTLFTAAFPIGWILAFPGLLSIVAGSAAFDILRRSKNDLLMAGNVPSIGIQGILLAVIGAAIPLALLSSIHGPVGWALATLASLFLSWTYYRLALHYFQRIGA